MAILPEKLRVTIFDVYAFVGNKHLEKTVKSYNQYKLTNAFGTLAKCFDHVVNCGRLEPLLGLIHNDHPALD